MGWSGRAENEYFIHRNHISDVRFWFEGGVVLRKLAFCAVGALVAVAISTGVVNASVTVSYGPFDCVFNGVADGGPQNWTPEQMEDVEASILAWDSRILNTAGRKIVLDLNWMNWSGLILGGSYSPSNGDGTTSWNYGEHIWRDGVDYDGPWDAYDTVIILDTNAAGLGWNFGSDVTGATKIDFRSVMTHELGHSLGFSATYDNTYDDWGRIWGSAADEDAYVGFAGLSAWDKNIVDSAGNRPENGGDGAPGNFNQVDNPVYWDGANAVAYNGGNVAIYAPLTYSGGSSLSHLDEDTFPNALMGPFVDLGPAPRAPTELEWQMMIDMGWDIATATVPEPGAMAIWAALGGLGLIIVRRRRKTT